MKVIRHCYHFYLVKKDRFEEVSFLQGLYGQEHLMHCNNVAICSGQLKQVPHFNHFLGITFIQKWFLNVSLTLQSTQPPCNPLSLNVLLIDHPSQ